jgi:hypothetical protein
MVNFSTTGPQRGRVNDGFKGRILESDKPKTADSPARIRKMDSVHSMKSSASRSAERNVNKSI